MLQDGNSGMVAVQARVHGRAGRSRIGTYKEIVAADVVIVVIRRTMGWNGTA